MKLQLFRHQASIGSRVTLRLTRGEDVTGRITELSDSHICLDMGHRMVTIFEDILAGWEVHDATVTPSSEPSRAEQPESPAPQPHSPQQPSPVVASAVLEHRARVDASFAERVQRAV